jgi:hypothetical protein
LFKYPITHELPFYFVSVSSVSTTTTVQGFTGVGQGLNTKRNYYTKHQFVEVSDYRKRLHFFFISISSVSPVQGFLQGL